MAEQSRSGGCQCGAVRFTVDGPLGRASVCHCRMCQKALGAPFAAFVSAPKSRWTRGAPSYFQSSQTVRRGFCNQCGTPLTWEVPGVWMSFAIATFDEPGEITPVLQIGEESRLSWLIHLNDVPTRTPEKDAEAKARYAAIQSRQHPDHDTEVWPSTGGRP